MQPKEQIEKLAKDHAFEYDIGWWGLTEHAHHKIPPKNGDIVAFYRSHRVFKGVVALWARNNSHAVIFYATPHDVADERKYGWTAPVFRVEVNTQHVYRPPRSARAANLEQSEEGVD